MAYCVPETFSFLQMERVHSKIMTKGIMQRTQTAAAWSVIVMVRHSVLGVIACATLSCARQGSGLADPSTNTGAMLFLVMFRRLRHHQVRGIFQPPYNLWSHVVHVVFR